MSVQNFAEVTYVTGKDRNLFASTGRLFPKMLPAPMSPAACATSGCASRLFLTTWMELIIAAVGMFHKARCTAEPSNFEGTSFLFRVVTGCSPAVRMRALK